MGQKNNKLYGHESNSTEGGRHEIITWSKLEGKEMNRKASMAGISNCAIKHHTWVY
jgi:hypothetical protein